MSFAQGSSSCPEVQSPVLSFSSPIFGLLEALNPVKPNNQKGLPNLVDKGVDSGLISYHQKRAVPVAGRCRGGSGEKHDGFANREKHLSASVSL